jgi:hypothetical protein
MSDNPYEPPLDGDPGKRAAPWKATLLYSLLVILSIPATLIAGFATCLVAAGAAKATADSIWGPIADRHEDMYRGLMTLLWVGLPASLLAIVVAALMANRLLRLVKAKSSR